MSNVLQIIVQLLPIIEQLIAAIEAAAHPGSTLTVPPQLARLRAALAALPAPAGPSVDDRLAKLETAVAEMHAAVVATAPKAMREAVGEVEPPGAG